ncbi:glycoside hydrolase family 125 protein [Persicobacter diffluens]
MNRRTFVKNAGLSTGLLSIAPHFAWAKEEKFVSQRPKVADRKFTSKAVEKAIKTFKKACKDEELAWMFENCFPNTLDTTVDFSMIDGKPDTFVITGDINAMWLRDSTAQVWPYLPFCQEDEQLKLMIHGLINRQTKCILIDPYANAFNKGKEGSHWENDFTEMKPELHERKWEIDSLCYAMRLSHGYWKATGDPQPFDDQWETSITYILRTFREQQRKEGIGPYSFMRKTQKQEDTVPLWGAGAPVNPVGLICSIFRPSDDATVFPFLIPSNYFAVNELRNTAGMLRHIRKNESLAIACEELADEVAEALRKYARTDIPGVGEVIPFEIDGFVNRLLMDDGNIPSCLSLPYLGAIDQKDPLYLRTRDFLLSEKNPYFAKGKAGEGITGPHVGKDYIWPMAIVMRAMTSNSDQEIAFCLDMLKNTHAGTGFMHETFHKDDAQNFTRSWFAWANTLFGELIWDLYLEKPALVHCKK